jgi:hypothetical protein
VLTKINNNIPLQIFLPLSEAEIQGLLHPAQTNFGYFLAWFQSLKLPSTQSQSPLAPKAHVSFLINVLNCEHNFSIFRSGLSDTRQHLQGVIVLVMTRAYLWDQVSCKRQGPFITLFSLPSIPGGSFSSDVSELGVFHFLSSCRQLSQFIYIPDVLEALPVLNGFL